MAFHWIGKSSDGETVTLKRLGTHLFQFPDYFNSEWESQNAGQVLIGSTIDVETSGLSPAKDKIIELGIRQFKYHRTTGEVLALTREYSSFQDPGEPISDEVSLLTGITNEMIQGKNIDWNEADSLLKESSLIIAHNAAFDRPFIEQHSKVSPEKIWGCSFKQMDWGVKGFTTQKLDALGIYHGIFTDSHRALNDSDALLYLLSQKDQKLGSPYFLELMNAANRSSVHVIASNSPFESKDLLKQRSYRWDGYNKFWSKHISLDDLVAEIEWLEKNIYKGKFRGRYVEIKPVDQFKGSAS